MVFTAEHRQHSASPEVQIFLNLYIICRIQRGAPTKEEAKNYCSAGDTHLAYSPLMILLLRGRYLHIGYGKAGLKDLYFSKYHPRFVIQFYLHRTATHIWKNIGSQRLHLGFEDGHHYFVAFWENITCDRQIQGIWLCKMHINILNYGAYAISC